MSDTTQRFRPRGDHGLQRLTDPPPFNLRSQRAGQREYRRPPQRVVLPTWLTWLIVVACVGQYITACVVIALVIVWGAP